MCRVPTIYPDKEVPTMTEEMTKLFTFDISEPVAGPAILAPEGTYPAVLAFITFGGRKDPRSAEKIAEDKRAGNAEEKVKDLFHFFYELDAKIGEEHPTQAGKRFMLKQNLWKSRGDRAKLPQVIKALLGKSLSQQAIDKIPHSDLLGCNCLVAVEHYKGRDGQTRAGIQSATQAMAGAKKMNPECESPPDWAAKAEKEAMAAIGLGGLQETPSVTGGGAPDAVPY